MRNSCFVIAILSAINLGATEWKTKHCTEECECELKQRVTEGKASTYAMKKTINCNGKKLKNLPIDIPSDVQVLLANENQLDSFKRFVERVFQLPNVDDLEVSRNEFADFASNRTGVNVSSLDASDNRVVVLPAALFRTFPTLERLTVRNNQINRVDMRLCRGKALNLRRLDISYNEIDHLEWLVNCTGLRRIRFLDVSGNKQMNHCLSDDTFTSLSSLISLRLEDMELKEIAQNAFSGIQALESLDLDDNWLSTVPSEALTELARLRTISLNRNSIVRIEPMAFSHLHNLRLIEMSGLPALVLVDENAFIDLPGLKTLLMFENLKLSYIDGRAFNGCPSLTTLDLHDSLIETVLEETVKSLPALASLNLERNPINCNCLMRWAISSARDIIDKDRKPLTCINPPTFRGSILSETDMGDHSSSCAPEMQPTFPRRATAMPNSRLILHCRAFGIPKPQIVWFLPEGNAVSNNTNWRHKNVSIDNYGSLTLEDVKPGYYMCIAENSKGKQSRTVMVQETSLSKRKTVTQAISAQLMSNQTQEPMITTSTAQKQTATSFQDGQVKIDSVEATIKPASETASDYTNKTSIIPNIDLSTKINARLFQPPAIMSESRQYQTAIIISLISSLAMALMMALAMVLYHKQQETVNRRNQTTYKRLGEKCFDDVGLYQPLLKPLKSDTDQLKVIDTNVTTSYI